MSPGAELGGSNLSAEDDHIVSAGLLYGFHNSTADAASGIGDCDDDHSGCGQGNLC